MDAAGCDGMDEKDLNLTGKWSLLAVRSSSTYIKNRSFIIQVLNQSKKYMLEDSFYIGREGMRWFSDYITSLIN